MNIDELFSAIKEGDLPMVESVIAAEPGLVDARNPEGLSPITVAAYWGKGELVDLLIETGHPLDFWEAAIVGDVERVGDLLEDNPSLVSERSPDGFTALHLAVFFGHPDTAQFLINAGAEVDARTTNDLSNQPIHAAVAGSDAASRLACAALLLRAGADPNSTQSGGFTPLMAAAQNGDDELVDLLLSSGATTDPVDDQGRSAADLAANTGNAALSGRLAMNRD